jgi:hypothetical protein
MMVPNIETSPLLEERRQTVPTEVFSNYAHHHQQAFNVQTHKQPMMVHDIEISPFLEERNQKHSTEAFNYGHQQAFNSLTSSMIMLDEEDSFYGDVSETGGDQVRSISNYHAQQQARESEEWPWEEQMALELEPTPLRGDKHDCLDWGRVRRY